MTRILLRAPKDPFLAASPRRTLRADLMGGDVGRLLAAQAVHRLLWTRDAEVVTARSIGGRGAAERLNAEFDHVVLPLGTAIGPLAGERLDALAEAVEALRVPVTVIGLGARLPVSGSAERLAPVRPAVVRLLRAVLDRSSSVGVAGELTARYLRGLGFRDVEAVGDPSLLFREPPSALRVPARLTADSAIAIGLEPGTAAFDALAARQVAFFPRLRRVEQSAHALERLLAARRGSRRQDPATSILVDPTPWVQHMASYDYAFGSRFSGVAAALLAGTPATLLAADGAALEAARCFDVPVRTAHRTTERTDAQSLLDEGDWSAFLARLPRRLEAAGAFLARNSLASVQDPGEDRTRFDRRAAAVAYPGDVSGAAPPRRAVPPAGERTGRIEPAAAA